MYHANYCGFSQAETLVFGVIIVMAEQLGANDDLEREKLRLEIASLAHQNSRLGRAMKVVPMLTTLVAVAGLVVTYWNGQSTLRSESEARSREATERTHNEALDRINRIQTQIRADKEQILEFATNDKTSSVRVSFLIDDLKSLIEQLSKQGVEKLSEQTYQDERHAVTQVLGGVAWDLRFDDRRHFDFDVIALKRWPEVRQFWKTFRDSHHLFLESKYYFRIKKLHSDDPPCLEKLDYDADTTILSYKNTGKACNEELIDALIYGFGEHLRVMKEANQSELLEHEVDEFGKLTNNAGFAQKLFARI